MAKPTTELAENVAVADQTTAQDVELGQVSGMGQQSKGAPIPRSRARAIYGFMLLMHFMLAIDTTSVAVALPVCSPRKAHQRGS